MDEDPAHKMSNSDMDSFLTRIGDVTIERVNPGGSLKDSEEQSEAPVVLPVSNSSPADPPAKEESSEESGGESSDGEQEKRHNLFPEDEMEHIQSEGSGDDMDLDETIDSQIGVRLDPEKQHSLCQDEDIEPVNILDSLPLEGAPIEGQEVTEADLLGKSVSKEMDEEEIDEDDIDKIEGIVDNDEEGGKRLCDPDDIDSALKKQKQGDQSDSSGTECETKVEKKISNMRRNIREVMDENQLDEATLAAQRQEMERLRRVQEQQRIIREVQRQIAINRQNSKTQTRVISLLQGKQGQSGTTISPSPSSQVRLPNTVLLKVNSGPGSGSGSSSGSGTHNSAAVQVSQQQPQHQQQYQQQQPQQQQQLLLQQQHKKALEAARWQKGRNSMPGIQTSISKVANRSSSTNLLQQRIRMMTPSVSISPVVPKKEPIDRSDYCSESEMSEPETDEVLQEKQLHTLRKVSGMPWIQKPAKGKDVVTISSSSESSDDDCIVLSDPSGGEETDNEDDPSNSGMHTNDRYNVPDEHGRVLVNVGHPETEPDVFLAPQVARIIKPHQIGGIRFLYDNIVESIERYKTSSGFGCILAHSMGLGKTLQVASFCDVFFRCTTAKTVLCIMPINTLQNWLAEFNMWLPYEASFSSDNQTTQKTDPQVDVKPEMKEENGAQTDPTRLSGMQVNNDFVPRMPQDNSCSQPILDGQAPHQGNSYNMQCRAQENIHKDSSSEQNFHTSQHYHNDMSMNIMYGAHPAPPPPTFDQDVPKPELDCQGMMKSIPPPSSMYPGNYPCNVMGADREIKQEFGQPVDIGLKMESAVMGGVESFKKEEEGGMLKDPAAESPEKKELDKVKTPYCVDSPIGLELRPRHFQLHILNDSHKSMAARARVIQDWKRRGGVLLIGYELYRQLSLKKPNKAKRKRGQAFKDMVDVEEDDKNKGLLDDMHSALVSPGPDLVICDEGHRIKNSHASISLALKQMRTKRRIVLTGYPLQNNLLEYWCMVDFVRPNYLGTKSEFCNMFERPIQNGQCIDSTPQDIRLMRYRAHVLHALLEGFVQRRSHSVLQVSLPRKEEYILLVRMTPHQRKLYDTFMTQVVKTRAVPNPLKAFAVCCKIWNHPDVLYHFLKKRQANEEDDLDLEETMGEKPTPGTKRTKARQPKGESKKGKKANNNATVKNKPAASVQPNSSSSSSNDNPDGENRHQNPNPAGNYQNYPMQQPQNTAYSNPTMPNTYPQGYSRNAEYDCRQGQNYRPNDQNNYYRGTNNTQQGEYGEFYGNQGQQRYTNPSFQSFPQGSGYNHPQGYQNQSQNYSSNTDQVPGSQMQNYNPSSSHNSDYRSDQNSTANPYNASGLYQAQCYPYQDQNRSYAATPNIGSNYSQVGNHGQNYQNQPPSQTANLSTIQEYPSYPTANAVQGYTPASNPVNQQIYPRGGTSAGQNFPAPTQSQTQNYPPNQQSQNSSNQSGQIFPRTDNQSQNFVRPQNQVQSHDYSGDQQNRTPNPASNQPSNIAQPQSVTNYSTGNAHGNQVTQFKSEDPYWQQNNYNQQNYRQNTSSDPYYTGNVASRYQNNYYPAQGFQNQRYEYNQTSGIDSAGNNDGKSAGRSVRNPGQEQSKGGYEEDCKDASTLAPQNQARAIAPSSQSYTTELTRRESSVSSSQLHGNDRNVGHGLTTPNIHNTRQIDPGKEEDRDDLLDKDREDKSDDEILNKDEDKDLKSSPGGKEDPGIPYDWATELMKGYIPGLIDASAKMSIFFCILEEAVRLGDRILAFSQSLFTLNLVEDFLARNSLKHDDGRTEDWAKNVNYYRLDGSTSALEREKLINEFNANSKIHLFLVSTRAGSLGINLVGANRAIVFDASWNPCHDTQAVCRVYRYGQTKPCFVYRLVTDNCLERKIYDRQISKQGMADRVVDQCNPDAHLSLKEAATLSWDWEEDSQVQDFSQTKDGYADPVMHSLLERHSSLLTKQPFRHESLLVDRKDKKLSQAEKRLARRGYELEKMAANCSRPSYNYVPGNTASRAGGLQIRAIRGGDAGGTPKPVASVRPMQQRGAEGLGTTRTVGGSRWIPAEVWQRQGMSAQEMTLPLDVVIPTNSPDKGSIVLKAGQRVMVLKSPKGIYMQLESGKIIAIRTALKLNQQKRDEEPKKGLSSFSQRKQSAEVGFPLRNNSAISIIPKSSTSPGIGRPPLSKSVSGVGFKPFSDKEPTRRPRPVVTATAKPYSSQVNITNQVSLSRLPRVKQEPMDSSSLGDNSNSSDSQLRTEQRVEEVRLEDVVAEAGSNSEYTRTDSNRSSNADSDPTPQKPSEEKESRTESYASDNNQDAQTMPGQQNEIQEVPSPSHEQICQPPPAAELAKPSLKNYRHNFPSHKPQMDTSNNDDVILEDPTPVQPALEPAINVNESASASTTQRMDLISPKAPETAPQVYPYSQYSGYYDYSDPRARSLPSPYGAYLPPVTSQTGGLRPPLDPAKETRIESEKPKETMNVTTPSNAYQQPSPSIVNARSMEDTNKASSKAKAPMTEARPREETHAPTAFSHSTNTRYPAPYPPGPYDAYSQHYPATPGSSTAYTAGAAPGYPAFGGPTYDAEYARVYSAFHGPPSAADPYMHRAYPPPPTHPTNYYPPFPHPPPPPYPNYSFLPPYPNPNLPGEPQPPAQ
ncbi:uncharacterized protein LOC105683701 isoform X1 [Athalia rosae]|uniref:uncharacterized protein LOC105683701 isoform X1 n=1 Tax=Athalia rosae TaxID=37344 RepID=UPI0020346942|nr:uncharacterized protein LOC105683701 isoform X1 [Athalia rosae]